MKNKKKIQSAIKVVFTKEYAGHKVGNVIATDMSTANFLIKKTVGELYVEKKKIEQPPIAKKEIKQVVKEKPKGRPKKVK